MEWPLSIALVVALLLCAKLFQGSRAARKAHIAEQVLRDSRIHEQEQVMAQQASQIRLLQLEISLLTDARDALLKRVEALSKYTSIEDVEAVAKAIVVDAQRLLEQSKSDANNLRQEAELAARSTVEQANLKSQNALEQAERRIEAAGQEAERIITAAHLRAEEIAGDAYTAMNRAKDFANTAQAMKNIIEGYGDAYIVPTYNLLDDLADEFSFTEAGQKLKDARDTCRMMVKSGLAATCDYVEANRKETAIRFVVDAFNGKVDSILSRSKSDNHGKLEQEIRDAFSLVNHNGAAFRSARITDSYLAARLEELKWAVTAKALKDEV